jgi:hypothetical protein
MDAPSVSNIYQLISYVLYVVILLFYKQSKDKKIEELEAVIKQHVAEEERKALAHTRRKTDDEIIS